MNLLWDKTFDNTSATATAWPGDVRRAECVYDINQTQDGGFIIGGNNSENFDNDYAIKIKENCTIPNGGEIIVDDYTVTGNEVWNTPHIVKGTITISPFSTLTIENTTIKFADTKQWNFANPGIEVDPDLPFHPIRLIVDHPASLIVNNSTLTALDECNQMWDGIIVKGNKTLSQDNACGCNSQGVIELNNATISHARNAIRLWNPDQLEISANNTDNLGETGGIIHATNSHFVNNTRSVEFMFYKNIPAGSTIELPNESYFKDCDFYTNNDYRNTYKPLYAHVTMWAVRGVSFKGCTFTNLNNTLTNITDLGKGIYSIDANYEVTNNGSRRSSFSNLWYGINASNSFKSTNNIQVNRVLFSSTEWNLLIQNSDNSIIKGNSFALGKLPPSIIVPSNLYIVGSGLVGSSQFTHEDNYFFEAGTHTDNTIGEWFINTGTGANAQCESKYSTLKNLPYATLANMNNRKTNEFGFIDGLQFRCNKNIGNTNDFFVGQNFTCPTCGIRDNQGLPGDYLNNTFSSVSTSLYAHYNNLEPNNIIYHVQRDHPEYIPDDTKINPIHFNKQVTINPLNTCPTKFEKPVAGDPVVLPGDVTPTVDPSSNPSGDYTYSGMAWINSNPIEKLTEAEKESMQTVFLTHKNEYNLYLAQLQNLIDAGNTPSMVAQVSSTGAGNASSTRGILLENSPFLSNEVLQQVVENSSFSLANIFEVLCANPQSGNNQELIDKLVAYNFPQWMIDYVSSISTEITPRKLLEFAISKEHEQMMAAHRVLIQDILNDPNGLNHIELRGWLGLVDDINYDYLIVDDYIENGEYSNAQNLMNELPSIYNIKSNEQAYYDNQKKFNDWRIDVLSNGYSYNNLNEQSLGMLQEMANSEDYPANERAASIINYFYDGNYIVYPQIPQQSAQRKSNPNSINKLYTDAEIKIFPNPANEYAYIEYDLSSSDESIEIDISNMYGQIIYKNNLKNIKSILSLNTQKWAAGMYTYNIKDKYHLINSGKINVQH